VTRTARLRSALLTAALVVVTAVGWIYLGPSNIGGSTSYVITHGISMEPRFHTGDLAIVRPAAHYKVGDIVAYHSTLLHVTVLHRIHAIEGNTYVFKGDNNDFLDPTHPTHAQLLGKLWLQVPRGGVWLNGLHSPAGVAIAIALLGTFVLFGVGERQRRRRKRRRKDTPGSLGRGIPLMNTSPDQSFWRRIDFGACLIASAVAAAVFLTLGLIAFTRPASKLSPKTKPYSQQVTFGYGANAPAGPVYPAGTVRTGDPIFLSMVRRLGVHVKYRFVSDGPHDVAGTESILMQLTSPTGWSRTVVLTPPTRFTGDHTDTDVTINLPQVQSLLSKVSRMTGTGGSSYSIAIMPRVHIAGAVGGHPLNLSFNPATTFQLEGAQLVSRGASNTAPSGGSSAASGSSGTGLTATGPGAVGTPVVTPATITVLGVAPHIALLRWISLLGLAASAAAAACFYLRRRSEPLGETYRIQSQYGHMIVPVVTGEDLGWPPVDVPDIKSLVKLAESGQRLILHNRANNVDTYMLNEEGTVYRYQVKPSNVVWGDWSESATAANAAETATEATAAA
jgi:signal peptidase I